MKKILAILMTLVVLMSLAVAPASALEAAETTVSVNKGDEVTYTLKVTTPEKVVGCDFSVYFDSSVLRVKKIADFTGTFDKDEYQAVINPNLKDEVRGNWSILSGVRFNNSAIVTVVFEATAKADTHLSYYVRYMYPESLEQFEEYTFACDVDVNNKAVIEDAAPELNVDAPQGDGLFVNSVTGDGKDADVNTALDVPQNNGGSNGGEKSEDDVENNEDNNDNSGNSGNTTVKKDDKKDDDKKEETKKADDKAEETDVATIGGADEPTSILVDTPVETENESSIFTSVWFWAVIVIVIGGGACAIVFYKKNKNAPATENQETDEAVADENTNKAKSDEE